MKYMICYDIENPDSDDYNDLYEEFERLDAEMILESQWMINIIGSTTHKVRKYFEDLIDNDDNDVLLLVIPFARNLPSRCSSSPLVTKLDKLQVPFHRL